MAKLRKRGKSYFVDFRIGNKRIRKNVGRDKKLADIALKDIEVRIARKDTGLIVKDYEIARFFEEYLEYSKTNHSPSTFKRYRGIIDHYKRFLKEKPWISKLSDLNAKFFEDYKTYRKTMFISKNGQPVKIEDAKSNNGNVKKGAKSNTINMEIKTFRTLLNMAIKWDYLSNNPMKGVTTLKVNDAKPPRFLTKEECEKLLESCNDDLYPVFFTFLHTGMRKAELENLEWQDIDFERRKIKIRRKDNWKPKTAEREIPISDELFHVLSNLRKKQGKKSRFVFCDKQGNKMKRKLRRDLMRLTKKCGFPDATKIHSLRHTFASHLVMNGVDLPTVQRLMGHTNIQTTMIYSHLAPDHLNEAVNKLNINGVRK